MPTAWSPGRDVRQRFAVVAVGAAAIAASCTGTSGSAVEVRSAAPEESTTTTIAADCAELLPPGAQAGQLLMPLVTSPQLASDSLASGRATGFGLKGRQSADVGEEIAAATSDAAVTPFVGADEEGGTVQRLGAALGALPSAAELSDGTPSDAAEMFDAYARSAAEIGVNMIFGPVADVGSGSDLGTRSFGDDPSTVASYTDAIIGAQEDAGVISVVKHWPGIGGGTKDPHLELESLAPIEELRTRDLVTFDRAIEAGASAIMVAHSQVPGLTAENEPATISSEAITGELRERQGFDGLILTDSLGMGAILETTPQDEAAELAISAGADIALLSGADAVDAAHTRLTDAIEQGRIPEDQVVASVRRVLAAKGVEGPCLDLVASLAPMFQDPVGSTTAPDDTTGTPDDGRDTGINDVPSEG